MEILSFRNNNIIKYYFNGFYAYYNPENGKSTFIPEEYVMYENDYFNESDLLGKPNKRESKSSFTICINITSSCNLRCHYCFNEKKENKVLDTERVFCFIREKIYEHINATKFFIDLSGSGEPLLYLNKIIAIAEYCSALSDEVEKEIILQFVTNGTLLNDENVALLQSHQILFGISVDGYQKLHDQNRVDINGKETYNAIIENYKRITHKKFIGAAMTIEDEETDIFRSYLNLCSLFETVSIRPVRREYKNFKMDRIINGYKEFEYYLEESALKNNDMSYLIKIINGDDLFGKSILKIISDSFMERPCDASFSRVAISSSEEEYPCSASVFMKEFKNLKNNQDFAERGKHGCNDCFLIHFCGGQCPLQQILYDDSSPLCELKKEIFALSLRLCGVLFLEKEEMYMKLLTEAGKILARSNEDVELLVLLHHLKGKYTYTELKKIKDDNKDKYNLLKIEAMIF